MPAILTVTTAADSPSPPAGSLRAVLAQAHSGDTINFASSLAGQTIVLQASLPAINENLTITGAGVSGLAISGANNFQVFSFFPGSTSSLSNLTIINGRGPHGGAVYNLGNLTVDQMFFNGNSTFDAGGGGGAIFNSGNLMLTNSLVEGGFTNGNGGGIFNGRGTMTVINSTIAGNIAVAGGAIANASQLTLENDTISGNSASDSFGGGIYNSIDQVTHQDAVVDMVNTIIAGNTANFGPDYWGLVTSSSHSLIGDNSGMTGIVSGSGNLVGTPGDPIDPRLGVLQDNGGPTWTMALLPGSPAIDSGAAAGIPSTDQRGFHRIVNGVPDMGAYEYQPPATQVTLSVSPISSTVNQALTVTATVAGIAPGSNTPTGTVTVFEDSTLVGTLTLNSGQVSFHPAALNAATHEYTAHYNGYTRGDFHFDTSSATPLDHTIAKANTATAVSVPASASAGHTVSLNAQVTSLSPGAITPTGTVTFYSDGISLGMAPLSPTFSATLTVAFLPVGARTITATYTGDDNFLDSTSPGRGVTVSPAATVTGLTNSPGTITLGQTVTLTATVNPSESNVFAPTGSVTFYDGTTAIGSASLSGHTAVLMTHSLGVGSHVLTARYTGDDNFQASRSGNQGETIDRAPTTTSITVSSAMTSLGQPVTFTASVGTAATVTQRPTGTVTFFDGTTSLGTATVTGTTATFVTHTLPGGSHTITATYNGDSNFAPSSSDGVDETVGTGAISIAIRSSANPSRVGHNVTFTAIITPPAGMFVAPSGTVTFYDGVAALGTVHSNGSTATITTSSLAVGRHTITARYNGDTNFGAVTSGSLAQVVSALGIFAIGGTPGRVQVRLDTDNSLMADFAPYGSDYTGGVSVAIGDINGDGYPDIVTGATTGNPHVKVFDGKAIAQGHFNVFNPDASLLAQFFPYALQFDVGANVAVGDINNDGFADIVTGATVGNPDVRVYNGQDIANGTFNPTGSSLLAQFFPYALQFNVGANVAIGDINGDGYADIVTGATAGNPDVRVYNGHDIATQNFHPDGSSMMAQFFAYALQFNVGANVAVGDTNGDGFGDIILGATVGNPHVRVISGQAIANHTLDPNNIAASQLDSFFAYDLQFNVGAAVAAADFQGDGHVSILTGATRGAPHFRVVGANSTGVFPPAMNGMEGIPTDFVGGISVGA